MLSCEESPSQPLSICKKERPKYLHPNEAEGPKRVLVLSDNVKDHGILLGAANAETAVAANSRALQQAVLGRSGKLEERQHSPKEYHQDPTIADTLVGREREKFDRDVQEPASDGRKTSGGV